MGKKSKRKTGKKNKKGSNGGGDIGGNKAAASNTNDDNDMKFLDKKCDERLAELQHAEETNRGMELQLSVGDRVLCSMSSLNDVIDDIDFSLGAVRAVEILTRRMAAVTPRELPGTIVQCWYCEPGKKNMIYPYQIRLDEGNKLIRAPSETSIMKTNLPPPQVSPHDELLFAQPPHREDCPICMIPLPLQQTKQTKYFSCCGKVICLGCIVHSDLTQEGRGMAEFCPFCRAPEVYGKENDERIEKRLQSNDPEAMVWSAVMLSKTGKIQDGKKSIQLMKRAAELGLCTAHYNLGCSYSPHSGDQPTNDYVERDSNKALFHLEKAAIAGHGGARYSLGVSSSTHKGDKFSPSYISMKHFMIGARSGYNQCLERVKEGFIGGMITKAEFEETLRMHKESLDEIKSEQRDKAAAMYPFTPS